MKMLSKGQKHLYSRMIITEEKIISNIYKVKKLISPNSKRQIIKLEDDAYFKDLVESITSYLREYPNKKNFPQDVYVEAYDLVEYATEEFARNNQKVKSLLDEREQNIKSAMLLKEAYQTVTDKDEGWVDNLVRYEGRFSKPIADSLTVIANEDMRDDSEVKKARQEIESKIANLESNLFIQIDLERIEDRTKALSYVGIEVADALRNIPAPIDESKYSKEEKEILKREIAEEKQKLEEQEKLEAERKKEIEEREKQRQAEDYNANKKIEKNNGYNAAYNVIQYNNIPQEEAVVSFEMPFSGIQNSAQNSFDTLGDLGQGDLKIVKMGQNNVSNITTVPTFSLNKNIESNNFSEMEPENDTPKIQNVVLENNASKDEENNDEFKEIKLEDEEFKIVFKDPTMNIREDGKIEISLDEEAEDNTITEAQKAKQIELEEELKRIEEEKEKQKQLNDIIEHADIFAKLMGKDSSELVQKLEEKEKVKEEIISESKINLKEKEKALKDTINEPVRIKEEVVLEDNGNNEEQQIIQEDTKDNLKDSVEDEKVVQLNEERQVKNVEQFQEKPLKGSKIVEEEMFESEEEKKEFFNSGILKEQKRHKGFFRKIADSISSIFKVRTNYNPELGNITK